MQRTLPLDDVTHLGITGLVQGCAYGLIALGFVLIYKATEVANTAVRQADWYERYRERFGAEPTPQSIIGRNSANRPLIALEKAGRN